MKDPTCTGAKKFPMLLGLPIVILVLGADLALKFSREAEKASFLGCEPELLTLSVFS